MRKTTSHLTELTVSAKAAISQASDTAVLDSMRAGYLGKKRHLTLQMTTLRKLPPEERPVAGVVISEAREQVQQALNARKVELESAALNACLVMETIGVSLPSRRTENGGLHPVTRTIDRIESFFGELGFTATTGPEIENNYHNSDVLNILGRHPTHTGHDTSQFDTTHLLHVRTSGVQVRTMEAQQPSIRIIAPDRICHDDYDQTHTPIFHRMEGLVVDTNISSTNLKGTLRDFLRNFFEEDLQIHFHPSYFPFTEPSAEVDVTGKNGKQLGVLSCGTVHPSVLYNVGVDLEVCSSSASGTGMERPTTSRHGVTDLCSFFENDLRFLKQFK